MLSWPRETGSSPEGDAAIPVMRTRPLRAAAAALLIAACASNPPALESTLRFWDLGARGADAIGSWRSQLVSGAGTDWTRKVLCRPDGACTFFGGTRGSF